MAQTETVITVNNTTVAVFVDRSSNALKFDLSFERALTYNRKLDGPGYYSPVDLIPSAMIGLTCDHGGASLTVTEQPSGDLGYFAADGMSNTFAQYVFALGGSEPTPATFSCTATYDADSTTFTVTV